MKRENESEMEPLWLPLEIWQEILCYLSPWQLFKYATFCKAWHTANLIHRSVLSLSPLHMTSVSPAKLSRMLNLRSLSFPHGAARYPYRLNSLVNLTHLDIQCIPSVDDDAVSALSKLTNLVLGESGVSINALLTLTALTELRLTYRNATIGDNECSQLTQLKSLSIETNRLLQGRGVAALTQLSTLRLFNGHHGFQAVCDSTIRGLTTLTKLLLEAPEVTDEGISCLVNLSMLELVAPVVTNQAIDNLSLLTSLRVYSMSSIREDSLKRKDSIRFVRTAY